MRHKRGVLNFTSHEAGWLKQRRFAQVLQECSNAASRMFGSRKKPTQRTEHARDLFDPDYFIAVTDGADSSSLGAVLSFMVDNRADVLSRPPSFS
jgi:hypothetical protein